MRHYIILGIILLLALTVWITSLGKVGIFSLASAQKILTAITQHLQLVGQLKVWR